MPPIRSTSTESPGPNATPQPNLNGEVYVADGDYIKDIEVNDLRNRYLLTKGSTQKMVNTPCDFLLIYFRILPFPASLPKNETCSRIEKAFADGFAYEKHASSLANPLCGIC